MIYACKIAVAGRFEKKEVTLFSLFAYLLLVYSTQVNSALRALWLATQTRKSMCYPPPSKTEWLPALFCFEFFPFAEDN